MMKTCRSRIDHRVLTPPIPCGCLRYQKLLERNAEKEEEAGQEHGTVPAASVNVEAITFESDDGEWVATITYVDGTSDTGESWVDACKVLGINTTAEQQLSELRAVVAYVASMAGRDWLEGQLILAEAINPTKEEPCSR